MFIFYFIVLVCSFWGTSEELIYFVKYIILLHQSNNVHFLFYRVGLYFLVN